MGASTFALVGLTALAIPAAASAAPEGHVIFEQRLRYESVDQDGFARDAQALTLRTRLGYETAAWKGFKVLVEGENVVALDDRYNSTVNGRTRLPTVADPEGTELNRAQVSWTGAEGSAVVGRQRLILGSARFVGNSGFRQNEQTFDAVRLDARPAKDVSLTYAYIDRVHRVFGPDSPQGEWKSRSHVVQLEAPSPLGRVTAYGLLLDLPSAPTQSSATFGAKLAGARSVAPGRSFTYEFEYARQTDYGSAPASFDVDYVALGLGLKSGTRSASVGFERLGGDGRQGFQTPLATLHAYQGWADVFLTTPKSGVRDLNLRAAATVRPSARLPAVKLQGALHDFADADGGTFYGREADASASVPLGPHLSAELKAARFDGRSPGFADRSKVWVTLEARY